MADNSEELEDLSDDEVFIEKLTLKEVKKRIFMNSPQHLLRPLSFSSVSKDNNHSDEESKGISIIETCSEPDLIAHSDLKSISSPNFISDESISSDVRSDDSLIGLDKMFSDLYIPPIVNKDPQLDSTLDVSKDNNHVEQESKSISIIETCSESDLIPDSDLKSISSPNFISNENQRSINLDECFCYDESDDSFIRLEKKVSELCVSPTEYKHPQLDSTLDVVNFILNKGELEKEDLNDKHNINCDSPKNKNSEIDLTSSKPSTPEKTHDLNKHPRNVNNVLQINENANILKTPKNPVSNKKQIVSSIKKTPNGLNTYQHITSPIATYIKKTPQAPLFKKIQPRKPLPSTSTPFIPKPIKTSPMPVNKENIELPSIAYKSAKKTKMVDVPNKDRLPRGAWTDKLASTLKKAVVITHEHRVVNSVAKNLIEGNEDSFDLTLQQADISICTKKSAFR